MKFCLILAYLTLASTATLTQLQAAPPPLPNPLPKTPYLQTLERLVIGLADEAGIQTSVSVTDCLDENIAGYYLQFIVQVLDQLSAKDWIELPETVSNFKEGTIPLVEDCLASDIGLKGLWDAYGIGDLSLVDLYVKFAAYAIGGNYEILMQNLTDIHTVFQREQYEIVGRLAGQLIRTVVNYGPDADQADEDDGNGYNYQHYQSYDYNYNEENGEGQNWEYYNNYNKYVESYRKSIDGYQDYDSGDPAPDLVYNIFEGFAAAVQQPPPTGIKSCLNFISGRIILNFILNIVGEINDNGFERIPPTIGGFERAMPLSSMKCFATNKVFKSLLKAYGIKEKTPQAFSFKLAAFGEKKDLTTIRKLANNVLIDADMEEFTDVGTDSSKILKLVWRQQ